MPEQQKVTFDKSFVSGVKSYNDEQWDLCIVYFESAITDYNFYKNTVIECRLSCKNQHRTSSWVEDEYPWDMGRLVMESECVKQCQDGIFKDRIKKEYSSELLEHFKKRIPYNYIQFCYYKVVTYIDF